ncbi:BT_3987 domain-containing protein [Parapedobacter deserti]|uniref:BT_3987 domain-containing protein n=1 Tax=Parapedobacter deserti TaxID=1912957 RepID=A0ABV7JPD8_9SPHI
MIRILYSIMVVCLLASCQEKELADVDLNTFVYMPQANQLSRKVLAANVTSDTSYYGASVNGFAPPKSDVNVAFSVDEALVDDYNDQNGVSFRLLPEASYTMADRATISKGRNTTEALSLVVDVSQLEPFAQYLLPITVSPLDGSYGQADENSTAYFLFDLIPNVEDYTRYDNTQWAVMDFSSHDPWEGGPDGNVHSLLNENGDNYWITQFGVPGPHWVVVDMKERKEVHGVTYMNRKYYPWHPEPQGFPKGISLELSDDGENWEQVLVVEDIPFPVGEVKDVWVSHFSQAFASGRYFRFTATDVHTIYSGEFNLACLSLF